MDEITNEDEIKLSAFSKVQQISLNLRKPQIVTKQLVRDSPRINKENVAYRNENYGVPIRHAIKELEIQRQEEVKNAVEARVNLLQQFSKVCEQHNKQEWLNKQNNFIKSTLQREEVILYALQQYDKKLSVEHEKVFQQQKHLSEQRRKQSEELKAKEREQEILKKCIEKIYVYHADFKNICQEILMAVKSFPMHNELRQSSSKDFKQITAVSDNFDDIIKSCKSLKVSEEEVKKSSDIIVEIKSIKERLLLRINEINDEVNRKKEAEAAAEEKKLLEEQQKKIEETNQTQQTELTITQHYISVENLKTYTDVMEFLNNYSNTFKQLVDDESLKSFKFDCKKAINIPVNAISAVNSEHLLDKYDRLKKLISGQTTTVSDKQINAARHPQGVAFCLDLLAKKFVLQADLMISSNPESAFCYATIISSLWNDFPDLGKLFLGYLYKACPYLVPYYIPQSVGMSDEDFYKSRGYQYSNEEIEKQDKFLKRMRGLMRLYAALLITKPKRGQQVIPHSLLYGWRWLISILKLEPEIDITATMLHTFLETAGFAMDAAYGKYFKKLLKIINDTFIPICREKCTGGAVTRLELLLTEYNKKGRFDTPAGYVAKPFW